MVHLVPPVHPVPTAIQDVTDRLDKMAHPVVIYREEMATTHPKAASASVHQDHPALLDHPVTKDVQVVVETQAGPVKMDNPVGTAHLVVQVLLDQKAVLVRKVPKVTLVLNVPAMHLQARPDHQDVLELPVIVAHPVVMVNPVAKVPMVHLVTPAALVDPEVQAHLVLKVPMDNPVHQDHVITALHLEHHQDIKHRQPGNDRFCTVLLQLQLFAFSCIAMNDHLG